MGGISLFNHRVKRFFESAIALLTIATTPTYLFGQNVGIGSTNPQAQLHVQGSATSFQPVLKVDVQGIPNPYLVITPSGNVGIGTDSPAQALTVSGNILFTGALMPGGNAGTSGFVLMSQGTGNSPVWVDTALLGDNWGSQVAITQSPVIGDGTSANPVTFAPGTTSGQIWKWDGTQWVLGNDSVGDNWGSQVAVTAGPVVGDGTSSNPITFASGSVVGDMWQWDGTTWQLVTLKTAVSNAGFDSVCSSALVNYVQKWTGSELCNSIIYDDGTKVGIGTNSPMGWLDVKNSFYAGTGIIYVRQQKSTVKGGEVVLMGAAPYPSFNIDNYMGRLRFLRNVPSTQEVVTILQNGNVGVNTPSPVTKLDVSDSVIIGPAGGLPNGVAAELHVGRRMGGVSTLQEVKRIAIQPYGHTTGPFYIVTRDSVQFADLDFRFGNDMILFLRKDTLSGYRGVGIGDSRNIGSSMLHVAKKTNSTPTDPTTLLSVFTLIDSATNRDASLYFYGYPNVFKNYLDRTFMLYTPAASSTRNLQIAVANTAGQIRFHIGGFMNNTTEIMNIQSNGVGIRTGTFNGKCVNCPLQVNGRMTVRNADAVYMSGEYTSIKNYHLIGTYAGWDKEAIYIGGYNYYTPEQGDTLKSYAKRLRIGSGTAPSNQMVVDFNNGNVGIGTDAPTEKLQVNGNIRSKSAFKVTVNGCNNNVCTYTVNFPVPFSTPPVVHITPGPNANPSWGPLIPLILSVTNTSVRFQLDSGNSSQAITGTKTIHIIAIAP
ncbi:MAG: hypothetical protein GXO48_00925 [Chlorobi bacterium]|nr:hypothetical protein [Chlorobiota bacterium]